MTKLTRWAAGAAVVAIGVLVAPASRAADCTPLQVGPPGCVESVGWQSITPVVIALLIALPLGTALGQWSWRLLARQIGVIDTPVIPVTALLLVTSGALVAAGLMAARSGQRAARTPAGTLLQEE